MTNPLPPTTGWSKYVLLTISAVLIVAIAAVTVALIIGDRDVSLLVGFISAAILPVIANLITSGKVATELVNAKVERAVQAEVIEQVRTNTNHALSALIDKIDPNTQSRVASDTATRSGITLGDAIDKVIPNSTVEDVSP